MLIVAIDTSGKQGSVALCRGDDSQFEILAIAGISGGTYSARLIPSVDDLLRMAELSKADIDGFVVVDGPGSFTGLRVGLATAKALSEALQKPLATVSMLEAMALRYAADSEAVTAVLDAGRGEMYVGEYRVAGGRAELHRLSIRKLADFAAQLPSQDSKVITACSKIDGATIVETLHADAIGRIGLRKLLGGEVADPTTLDANYVRRSDAELFSLPRT